MVECGMYYATADLPALIQSVGGEWGDVKHRPIICLVRAVDNPNLFWAIPMGNLGHQGPEQLSKINRYMNLSDRDIRSCYYHVGRTTTTSLFFISDAFPITDKYIERPHYGYNNQPFIIKNTILIGELERKLSRILAFENSQPNHFRQRITDVKKHLILELNQASKEVHKSDTDATI